MATITPTFQLKANTNVAAKTPGPISASLALSITDALAVDLVDFWSGKVSVVSDDAGNAPRWGRAEEAGRNTLVDGSVGDDGAARDPARATSATLIGCWIYVVNTMTTGSELIHIGHTTDADATGGGNYYDKLTADDKHERLFSLKAGEFAFFPFDYTGDLYIDASAADQTYEFWRFDRA